MWDWQREKLGSGVITTQASATPMEALSLRWPSRVDMSRGKTVVSLYPHTWMTHLQQAMAEKSV